MGAIATHRMEGFDGRSIKAALGSLLVAIAFLPGSCLAANYGADTYGGGNYGIGIVPAPTAPPSSGGGGVIGGPLGIGYVFVATKSAVIVSSTSASEMPTAAITSPSPAEPVSSFSRSIQYLDRSPDVARLQGYLNSHGFPLTDVGDGSPGHETQFFVHSHMGRWCASRRLMPTKS